jgi:hypothetical protein
VMNSRVSQKTGNFLSSWVTFSFSRRSMLHCVSKFVSVFHWSAPLELDVFWKWTKRHLGRSSSQRSMPLLRCYGPGTASLEWRVISTLVRCGHPIAV